MILIVIIFTGMRPGMIPNQFNPQIHANDLGKEFKSNDSEKDRKISQDEDDEDRLSIKSNDGHLSTNGNEGIEEERKNSPSELSDQIQSENKEENGADLKKQKKGSTCSSFRTHDTKINENLS